jgi:L-amino acid N-acyltransferase YncA
MNNHRLRISTRHAGPEDVDALFSFLYEHGVNEWNHLPEGPIRSHLQGIARGSTHAVLAEQDGQLVGFVSFELGVDMDRYQPPERKGKVHGIVHEAVVHQDSCGKGIGAMLLTAAAERIGELGCQEVYVGRHDENLASAGMMRKAGFEVIDVFDDPRRTYGNRKTAISRRFLVSPLRAAEEGV